MTEGELERLIDATKSVVFQSIRRHLPADLGHSVEDVFQETYLRFYLAFRDRALPQGDGIERWLYVAARNESRKAARAGRRRGRLFQLLRGGYSPASESKDPESKPAAGVVLSPLDLSGLPEAFRETMQLRKEGFSLNEIAARTGAALGTVKSRLARAREWLAREGHNNAGKRRSSDESEAAIES